LKNRNEIPIHVNGVHVVGAKITKSDIFEREIQEALQSHVSFYFFSFYIFFSFLDHQIQIFSKKTLGEALDKIKVCCNRLEKLEIFKQINVRLDVPKNSFGQVNAVDIYLEVEEKSRLKAETGTYIGNQEGSVVSFYLL